MRCHFIYDEETKTKILIPHCWSSLHQEDLSMCTCVRQSPKTANEEDSYIKTLEKENAKLNRIIKKLTHGK